MACVLLIDDDPLVRRSLKIQLEHGGHVVSVAADGGEGLDVFQNGGFDVVLTDILMPDVEGVETVRRLRRLDRTVVIIAMTGGSAGQGRYDGPDYLRMIERLGANVVIRKPFGPGVLLKLIEDALAAAADARDAEQAR